MAEIVSAQTEIHPHRVVFFFPSRIKKPVRDVRPPQASARQQPVNCRSNIGSDDVGNFWIQEETELAMRLIPIVTHRIDCIGDYPAMELHNSWASTYLITTSGS